MYDIHQYISILRISFHLEKKWSSLILQLLDQPLGKVSQRLATWTFQTKMKNYKLKKIEKVLAIMKEKLFPNSESSVIFDD